MVKRICWLAVVIAVLLTAVVAFTAEEEKNEYVGDNATKCKMCHKAQVEAWSKWPMAGSWDRLSDEEKTKDECVACHVTGYGEPCGFVNEKDTPKLVGVQCEACHGPAGNHLKAPLTDKEKRRATISRPGEDNCLTCHKEEGNPNFKEFEFDEAVKELVDHLEEEREAGEEKAG
jgi:hypothetical protein